MRYRIRQQPRKGRIIKDLSDTFRIQNKNIGKWILLPFFNVKLF